MGRFDFFEIVGFSESLIFPPKIFALLLLEKKGFEFSLKVFQLVPLPFLYRCHDASVAHKEEMTCINHIG